MNAEIIPSYEECYQLMKKEGMLPSIMKHSEQVMRVSLAIVDDIEEGIEIDRDLVIAGSLLHDITKTRSISTKEAHDITGGEVLRGLGFNAVADIVEEHVSLRDFKANGKLEEKEIVFYADKRVMHTKIVSVEDRIKDLFSRYKINPAIRNLVMDKNGILLQLEEKIAGFMKRDIDEVIYELTR